MAVVMQSPPAPMISTVDALWSLIQAQPKKVRKALSIRMSQDCASASNVITPAMAIQIRKAREEFSRAETIRCNTPEEMQRYFDSL